MSISTKEGLPVFYFLYCALNGLRDASLAWLHLLSSLIKPLGLLSDAREPCLFSGAMWTEERWSRVVIVMYVDDLLIIAECAEAEKRVLDTIGKRLTVKVTGHILPASKGGGVIDFLGRTIRRWPGSSSIEVGVRANYLESCFEAYSVSKGTSAVPDIASLLDKTGTPGLTPEAYSKFRRVLGKVLWLAQTRQDLKLMVGLISTQQAEPSQATESALRALLRFLYHDRNVVLHLPSPELTPEFLICDAEELLWKVHVFADASHAPYRFLGRRGITGGAICFAGSLVRSMAKTQGVVCLSSCEAELHALQFMAQESVAFVHLLERVLIAFGDLQDRVSVRLQTVVDDHLEESETCEGLVSTEVLSDSQAGLDVISAEDVPRRSRHIEIRLAWLRLQVENGRLSFRWIKGETNPADLFTKNVGTKLFSAHRLRLGFDEQYGQLVDALHLLAQLSLSKDRDSSKKVGPCALLEVCCEPASSLCEICRQKGVAYTGIVANMEEARVYKQAQAWAQDLRSRGVWLHVHVSTPCSSGSPLKAFTKTVTEADFMWEPLMRAASKYLKLGDAGSFELPLRNHIWKRELTQQLLSSCHMFHGAVVHLCATGQKSKSGLPVGKSLRFACTHEEFASELSARFGSCTCERHAPMLDVNYHETGNYNSTLAAGILAAAAKF